jgi:tRNA/tmRNA/rRNA uracil-C5-methylase (TrmA/RlmC/RlmD family)
VSEVEFTAQKASWLGRRLEVTVGPIAHGGHCVARFDGRVIFVRHALPGEQVLVEITEDRGGSFCRGDAVSIRTASADRVAAPCAHARPGGCGGCDFQHVSLEAQRALKAAVVAEQLHRLAGIDRSVAVQPLSADGLGWRRRIRYAVAPDGGLGLRAHRSHQVIPIGGCPLGAPGVGDSEVLSESWHGAAEIEVAVDDDLRTAVLRHREAPAPRGRHRDRRASTTRTMSEQVSGPRQLHYRSRGRTFQVQAGGFWQTHPDAADAFVEVVLANLALRSGEQVLDLYAGAGLFTSAIADVVGQTGRIIGVEGDRDAASDAGRNLVDRPWAEVRAADVTPAAVTAAGAGLDTVAAVVLDPPRTGAGREVMGAILSLRPRVVVYVACDPAALARDLRTALDAEWKLTDLQAFDAFPMTHHIECIATLTPGDAAE